MTLSDHLIIAPIVVPLLAGAVILLVDSRNRAVAATISLFSTFALFGIAVLLASQTADADPASSLRIYRLGDWPAQFGIVLVADKLSCLMLLLTSLLACGTLVFAIARWHRAGSYFHPLFQFLLAGLNGAFLTGDLFNLFVFFEVLLAASYGLALHGSGLPRVRAGVHYIAINLAASFLFLIGVALIYGSTGTLNMFDIALRIPALGERERVLLETGASILGIAFLVKSAMWPLGFWLPATYSAASAPVAAMFAIMTKVGIYAVLRVGSVLAGPETDGSVLFGAGWLLYGGIATVFFASLGMLASQELARLSGFTVLISSGTLLAVIGMDNPALIGPALYYLFCSTLAAGAFFLLIELIERGRERVDDVLAVTLEAYGLEEEDEPGDDGAVGVAVPATLAVLGIAFIGCALLLSGLPPLAGFVAKFALLSKAMAGGPAGIPGESWLLLATLLISGFVIVLSMVRAGIRTFWAVEREVPHIRLIEIGPVMALLLLCLIVTVQAGPALRFMDATAASLQSVDKLAQGLMKRPAPPAAEGGTR